MAQTKRIVPEPAAPETLPDDFSDWDGGNASATLPADSKSHDALSAAHPPVKERAQTTVKVMPTQRSVESVKEAPARPAQDNDSDVDAFLKRLNEVNVAPAQPRRQERDDAARYKPATSQSASAAPTLPVAPVRQEPPAPKPPAPKPADVEQELLEVFRTGYKEVDKEEPEGGTKKRWGLIGGIAAGVVAIGLAIGIPLSLRGKNVTPPRPADTPSQTVVTDESASALKPSPSSPANATTAKPSQQPKPVDQQQATPTTTSANQAAPVSSDLMTQQLNAGSQLPQAARQKTSEAAPPPSGFGVAGMEAASDNGAIGNVFKSQSKIVVGPSSVKVSAGVAGGMLIRKTPPEYPSIAKTARVSGTVVLAATITKTGRVSNLQVISGPPMLRQAAMDAVRNWMYKPYLLNNQPTEVQTTINVDFNL
jgi:periplasmic protein TonB